MIKIISTGDKNCPMFGEYAKRIVWKHKILTYHKIPDYLTLVNPKKESIILLDERGKEMSSITFAHFIEKQEKDLCFIEGGATGFPKELYDTPHQKLSLSHMTFPHEIARILLIEQIYRAQQILAKHPYHKA